MFANGGGVATAARGHISCTSVRISVCSADTAAAAAALVIAAIAGVSTGPVIRAARSATVNARQDWC